MNEIVFTTPALLDFLSQIDELESYPLELHEDDNNIQIVIGDSIYNINSNHADQIQVKTDVVQEVSDIAYSTCETLSNSDDSLEPIESGMIKEFAKTLLVGGLVRLTNKVLKK